MVPLIFELRTDCQKGQVYMAIYGFGAAFGGSDDMTARFIEAGGAFVGYSQTEAPVAHEMLRMIEVGDIAFLKSFPPSTGLIVKAVGIVVGSAPFEDAELGHGVRVRWITIADDSGGEIARLGKIRDKADFTRGGTLYREYSPTVNRHILKLLLGE